jgi:hypothetical protein
MKGLLAAAVTVAISLAVCLAVPAHAQNGRRLLPPRDANQGYKDGLAILKLCVAEDNPEIVECIGFIEGVSDLFVAERKAAGLPNCYPPGNGKVDQMIIEQTFVNYMIAHPERRPEEGAALVKAAIQDRFCPK